MNFLIPAFLVGGGLLALPLLLHFLRKKPTRMIPFPTLRFLGPTVLRETRKHRIRRWIVLALRCLAILLLVFAFARPFFAPPIDMQGTSMIVAVDNSFSMQAGNRWESLKAWALEQTFFLGPKDRLGVLVMHPTPVWLVPLSDNIAAGQEALRNLAPGFYATRYEPALRMAGEALAAAPSRTRSLVWMADEQRLGWTQSDFGTPLPDGVTFVAADPQLEPKRQASVANLRVSAQGEKLVAEATVAAPIDSDRVATLRVDGKEVGSEKVSLRPRQTQTVRFPPIDGAGGEHVFEVALDPDDLPADDTAYALWQPNEGAPVILPEVAIAKSEADFLAHAIAAARPESGEPLKAIPWKSGEGWEPGSMVVLRGEAIFQDAKLDDFLKAGGQAWLLHDGSPVQKDWLQRHGVATKRLASESERRLGNVDLEHPIVKPFAGRSLVGLLNLRFDRAWGFDGEALLPIAQWADGSAALAELRIGEGTVLVSGFDLSRADGNLVIETAFVPLVHGALTWLHRANEDRSAVQVGDTVSLPGGPGTLIRHDASSRQVEGAWVADRPGAYRFESAEKAKAFAVNVSVEESDLAPWPSPADLVRLESGRPATYKVARTAAALSNDRIEQQSQMWWWLLGLAAMILLAEMTLANRTAA